MYIIERKVMERIKKIYILNKSLKEQNPKIEIKK